MSFDTSLATAWNDHGADPQEVLARLPAILDEATEPLHAARWAGLAVHVAGEHLGRWDEGLALLSRATALAAGDAGIERSLGRSRAILLLGRGDEDEARSLVQAHAAPEWPVASSLAHTLATAASALAAQSDAARAARLFEEAVRCLGAEPDPADPAVKSLAITGNNLAMALEEAPSRSPAQDALMTRAARVSRALWPLVGDASNVLLADVRAASSHLAAGEVAVALEHGRAAWDQAQQHPELLAGVRLQAALVLARAKIAAGDPSAELLGAAEELLESVPETYQAWFVPQVEALRHAPS